jgi:hypothetical protein
MPIQDQRRQFGDDAESLNTTMARLVQEMYQRNNCNQDATYRDVRVAMDDDARWDRLGYDRDRVLSKTQEVGRNGGKIDWTDPWLRPGGQKRPGWAR